MVGDGQDDKGRQRDAARAERERRLAEALRSNLRRRKAAARPKQDPAPPPSPDAGRPERN